MYRGCFYCRSADWLCPDHHMRGQEHLFTLRVPLSGGPVVVSAYDGGDRLDLEVDMNGREVFPRGRLALLLPKCLTWSIDGIRARWYALQVVAATYATEGRCPRDANDQDYEPHQIAFSQKYGEELYREAWAVYADDDGNAKETMKVDDDPLEVRDEHLPTS